MLSFSWSPACQLRRDKQGCRVYLGGRSIADTLIVRTRHKSSEPYLTHDTPGLLIVVNVYSLVKSI